MSDCPRSSSWFRSCQFEARFDTTPHNGAGVTKIDSCSQQDLEMLLLKKTYVRDVCVRCGKTIERGQS